MVPGLPLSEKKRYALALSFVHVAGLSSEFHEQPLRGPGPMDEQAPAGLERSVAAYQRAERFLPWIIKRRVLNAELAPYWIGDSDRFWYRRQRVDGHEFVLVDAATAKSAPAFDHARLARALAQATGQSIVAGKLPFDFIEWVEGSIRFMALGGTWLFDPAAATCRPAAPPPASPSEIASPDGTLVAFIREHDLWLRTVATGAERRLNADGVDGLAYAKSPDSNLSTISHRLAGITLPRRWSGRPTPAASSPIAWMSVGSLPCISCNRCHPKGQGRCCTASAWRCRARPMYRSCSM